MIYKAMIYKVGDTITYTNDDGTATRLEAQPVVDECVGCVGQHNGRCNCTSRVCDKLPLCMDIIWKEAV